MDWKFVTDILLNKAGLLALFVACTIGATGVCADSSIVREIRSPGLDKNELAQVLGALGLLVGHPLDEKRVRGGLQVLHSQGRLQDLVIETETLSDGVRVTIRGESIRRIRNLRFSGLDSDTTEEITARINVEEGQVFDARAAQNVRAQTGEVLDSRGFHTSETVLKFVQVPDGGEWDVEVSVLLGEPSRIGKIQVTGGSTEENEGVRGALTLRKGDVLTKRAIEENTERINKYLQENQYPTSRVERTERTFGPGAGVDVTVMLRMNEKFQFLFKGNTVFDEVDLRGVLTDDVLSQSDSSQKIAERIETKYRTVGFHFCKVKVEASQRASDRLNLVRLVIDEGDKVKIDKIHFSGGRGGLSEGELASLFREVSPGVIRRGIYWEAGMTQGMEALKSRLSREGYLAVSVGGPRVAFSSDNRGVELFFDIEAGLQSRVSRIEFDGLGEVSQNEALEIVTNHLGDVLDREKMDEARKKLIELYQSRGYADVKIVVEESNGRASGEFKAAALRFVIQAGPKYRVGTVAVEGNRKTRPEVILREMKLEAGSLYDISKVRESEAAISTLGLFSRVEVIANSSTSSPDQKDLRVVVRENQPGLFEMGFGGFYEDPRFRLRSFLGIGYRNLWGLNQAATARMEVALPISRERTLIPFVEYSGSVGYRSPNPFNIPIIFTAQFLFDSLEVANLNNRITLQTTTRVEGRIEKRFSKHFTGVYRLYQLERTITEDIDNTTPARVDIIGSTGPGAILDFRDDVFNPRKGSYHTVNLEIASPILASEDDIAFMMLLTRNSFYVPLVADIGLTVVAAGGYARSLFAGKPIPTARLAKDLSLGGAGSIRGFSVRRFTPVDATTSVEQTAFLNGRAEINIPIYESLSFATFFDTGEIYPSMRAAGRHDGVGLGLRYKTPIGPIVIDLAQGLGRDKEVVKFYFTVGVL